MSANPLVAELGETNVIKSGIVKKRSGRMHQWTTRFFVLSDSKISYKIKQDSQQYKFSFDLSPGCIVTDINVENRIQGKKLYGFWIVWPHDKTKDDTNEPGKDEESDDERDPKDTPVDDEKSVTTMSTSVTSSAAGPSGKPKDLKHIVESEVMTMRRQRSKVEEQIELHTAADNNVSMGAKVAAVALGGVVVGALTAGIGLVPYFTVVGIGAAAGGSAVAWQWKNRKPLDSRLIMACDSMQEAIEWKTAIEHQISRIEDHYKPALPKSVDPRVISSILERETLGGVWRRVAVCEQMLIYEHVLPSALVKQDFTQASPLCMDSDTAYSAVLRELVSNDDDNGRSLRSVRSTRCRRASLVLSCTPINIFLSLMNTQLWPQNGSVRVLKELDDHADVIGVEVNTETSRGSVTRRMSLSRFWTLDDDGVYVITLNSTTCDEFPNMVKKSASAQFRTLTADESPSLDVVVSISPRTDCADFEFDLQTAMVSVHCQVSVQHWENDELVAFVDNFLKDSLLQLQHHISLHKYFSVQNNEISQEIVHLPPALILPSSFADPVAKPLAKDDAPQTRRARRGVTTVQPGADDDTRSVVTNASSREYEEVAVSSRELQAAASATSPNTRGKSMLGFFGRSKKDDAGQGQHSSATIGSSSPTKSITTREKESKFAESHPPPVQLPTNPQAKRDKGTNSQANLLRGQIAATEYELHRLTKSMRKKVIVSPPALNSNATRVDKHHVTPSEYSALQDQQSALQRKLQLLRQKHVSLTGETYEQAVAAQRSTLGRLRAMSSSRKPLLPDEPSQCELTGSESAAAVAGKPEDKPRCAARPAHWISFTKKQPARSMWLLLPSLLMPSFWSRLWCLLTEDELPNNFRPNEVKNRATAQAAVSIVVVFLFAFIAMQSVAETVVDFTGALWTLLS